jgi:hypothetical protein
VIKRLLIVITVSAALLFSAAPGTAQAVGGGEKPPCALCW